MAERQMIELERLRALDGLPLWGFDAAKSAIRREFTFADFAEAWGFMKKVAVLAQEHKHHPDWSNSNNRVSILLTTHDVGGLSRRDIALAIHIDALVSA